MIRRVIGITALLWLVGNAAWAQVARFPTGAEVSVTGASAVNINWIVTGTPNGVATSTTGFFLSTDPGGACPSGTEIGRANTTVRVSIGSGGRGRTVETVMVPLAVTDLALRRRLSQLFYCREFSGAGPAAANRVTLRLGSSAFATFSIARVELFFENGRGETTVPLGQPDLKVFADVSYNGSGMLQAVWEVADPGICGRKAILRPPTVYCKQPSTTVVPESTGPAPTFRTLHVVNRFLSFGDRAILTLSGAPLLPTTQPGEYTVNLRFVDPPVGFRIPAVRYFVEAREHPQRLFPIALRSPGEGAALALQPFEFRWEAVPKVAHYRLDVYPQEPVTLPAFPGVVQGPATNPSADGTTFFRAPRELGTPTAAVLSALIPPEATTLTLTRNQLAKLSAGRGYLWQIKGIDPQGNVVAESLHRPFTLQAR